MPKIVDLIRRRPLGTLVLGGDRLEASQLPFVATVERGRLRLEAHVALANGMVSGLRGNNSVLVIFLGEQGYISPSLYAGKQVHGRVVPTWNYIAVHAYGICRLIDDQTWLKEHLERLTAENERNREHPWAVTDAPEEFVDAQIRGIIGLEIDVVELQGKWKLSQNRNAVDKASVVAGLSSSDDYNDRILAKLIAEENQL